MFGENELLRLFFFVLFLFLFQFFFFQLKYVFRVYLIFSYSYEKKKKTKQRKQVEKIRFYIAIDKIWGSYPDSNIQIFFLVVKNKL